MAVSPNLSCERPPRRFAPSLLFQAELTKLRFAQLLERTSVMCHRSFVSDRVSFYDGSYRRAEFPFFAKKGWTRPQENAAKHECPNVTQIK